MYWNDRGLIRSPFRVLHREITRHFDELLGHGAEDLFRGFERELPLVNLTEDETSLRLEVELPGFKGNSED